MHILFLSLYAPYPPVDGGRIRTFNILKEVASRHVVTMVCFEDPVSTADHQKDLREWCKDLVVVPSPRLPRRGWLTKVRDLPRRDPIGLRRWSSPQMRVTLSDLVRSGRYDLAHIDHIALAQYSDLLRSMPRVITHHNVEHLILRRAIQVRNQSSILAWFACLLEDRRWMRYEIEASRRADAVVTVSALEAAYFRKHIPEVPIFVVPNGVDTHHFLPIQCRNSESDLLFTGRMDYGPNVDAMVWFCHQVLPIIQYHRPEASLMIVGRDPTSEVRALGKLPGVRVTGMVEDIRPYFGQANVYVVPLRFGGGTRLKILEAMATGTPIVSTSVGSEGLDIEPGSDLLVADGASDFATAVVELLGDKARCSSLSAQGRRTVERNFEWATIGGVQDQAYWQAQRRGTC